LFLNVYYDVTEAYTGSLLTRNFQTVSFNGERMQEMDHV